MNAFVVAMKATGVNPHLNDKSLVSYLTEAGFVDIKVKAYKIPWVFPNFFRFDIWHLIEV